MPFEVISKIRFSHSRVLPVVRLCRHFSFRFFFVGFAFRLFLPTSVFCFFSTFFNYGLAHSLPNAHLLCQGCWVTGPSGPWSGPRMLVTTDILVTNGPTVILILYFILLLKTLYLVKVFFCRCAYVVRAAQQRWFVMGVTMKALPRNPSLKRRPGHQVKFTTYSLKKLRTYVLCWSV